MVIFGLVWNVWLILSIVHGGNHDNFRGGCHFLSTNHSHGWPFVNVLLDHRVKSHDVFCWHYAFELLPPAVEE